MSYGTTNGMAYGITFWKIPLGFSVVALRGVGEARLSTPNGRRLRFGRDRDWIQRRIRAPFTPPGRPAGYLKIGQRSAEIFNVPCIPDSHEV